MRLFAMKREGRNTSIALFSENTNSCCCCNGYENLSIPLMKLGSCYLTEDPEVSCFDKVKL